MAQNAPSAVRLGPEDPATAKLIERMDFVQRRPKYSEHVGTLLATVSSCGDFGKVIPHFALEEAHEHVYGTPGCKWCQNNFEDAVKDQDSVYNRPVLPTDDF